MVARGRVHNGVVVLADGVRFPEGQEVTVLAYGKALANCEKHSILDIPPVTLGSVVRPYTADDDLLGEMLEGTMLSFIILQPNSQEPNYGS